MGFLRRVLLAVMVAFGVACTKKDPVPSVAPTPIASLLSVADGGSEAQWLEKYPKFVTRSGPTLTLRFADGKTKEFTTKRGDTYETYHVSEVRKVYPEQGLVEIYHRFYEGDMVELYSMATGDLIRLEGGGELEWSPNRRYFVWGNSDESSFTEPQTLVASCKKTEKGAVCRAIYSDKKEGGTATWKADESGVEVVRLPYDAEKSTGWVESGKLVCRLSPDKAECTETKK